MSEWGTHPISSEFWTVGSQSTNKYCREEIYCTTVLHHCITPHQHCIKSPTHCTTLPMMHNSTSHWGQHKPDLGQAKVTTTILFTDWRWIIYNKYCCVLSSIQQKTKAALNSSLQGRAGRGNDLTRILQPDSSTLCMTGAIPTRVLCALISQGLILWYSQISRHSQRMCDYTCTS